MKTCEKNANKLKFSRFLHKMIYVFWYHLTLVSSTWTVWIFPPSVCQWERKSHKKRKFALCSEFSEKKQIEKQRKFVTHNNKQEVKNGWLLKVGNGNDQSPAKLRRVKAEWIEFKLLKLPSHWRSSHVRNNMTTIEDKWRKISQTLTLNSSRFSFRSCRWLAEAIIELKILNWILNFTKTGISRKSFQQF